MKPAYTNQRPLCYKPRKKHNMAAINSELNALFAKAARRKYGNTKCEWQGEKFDSKRELERHLVLLDMQKRGEIGGLLRQPRYRLVVNEEHICDYVGDWFYTLRVYGSRAKPVDIETVEDCKGFQTPEFKLKWKLCKALYPEIDWRLS